MNIILIGFMATGKTTIGRKLAARLGYKFVDTDHYIEYEQECRVKELFETKGEGYFRQLETSLLKRLSKVDNTVVSTGGGILVTDGNMTLINKIGRSIHLKADIEDICERIMRNTKRPLVQTENPIETIKTLYDRRKELYQMADITIDTHSMKMWHVVSKIITELGKQS